MASTLSVSCLSMSCSSHATVHYTTEQAVNMVVDDQSLNVLTADSDGGSV